MIESPQILESDRHDTAVIHMRIRRDEMRDAFSPAVEELFDALAQQDVEAKGPVFAHHLRMDPDFFDFELGVPVDRRVRVAGRLKPGELPATRVARTVYSGDYAGLPEAWAEFGRWMKQQGLTPADDLWEVYAVGPDKSLNPNDWRTELNRPVR